MLGEIARQRVEQLVVRRLTRPWGRQWRLRVLARQIERIHRVHDAEAEELLPDQVDRGARELWMSRQHPRELWPQRFAQVGFFASQNKSRMDLAAFALQTNLTPALRVIAGTVFRDCVSILVSDYADARPAEEGGHGPKIFAFLRDQIEADLF